MSTDKDIRGYINPAVPGTTDSGQRHGMTASEVYVEDRTGKVVDALIRGIRPGRVVQVHEAYCLAPALGRADRRRRILAERIDEILHRGGVIAETATGLRTDQRAKARILLRAYEQIASSGRARKRDVPGRPPKWNLTPHEREIIQGIWQSRKLANDAERAVAVEKRTGKKISKAWLRLQFGSPHHKRSNKA